MTDLEMFRMQKDEFFRTDAQSPLTPEQQKSFIGLDYFPPNPELDLVVEVQEFDDKKTIQVQTSSGDIQEYARFGRAHFSVEGQPAELTIYRNADGYFLPFVDALAGKATYGAGRYVEPERLADGRFHIDFNMAYNPYCAYNARWSCPLTPFENRLKVPIRAGEKLFAQHE
jgi:uncharacterized protein (DUF1684 family)